MIIYCVWIAYVVRRLRLPNSEMKVFCYHCCLDCYSIYSDYSMITYEQYSLLFLVGGFVRRAVIVTLRCGILAIAVVLRSHRSTYHVCV